MLPMFQRPEQYRQREELLTRKKLLREINGQEIDRIKGVDAQGPDKDTWLRYHPIEQDDDDATKAMKYYHNSLVISKKPYFFRYLYPELNKKYKQYENAYNEKSKAQFGMKFKKVLALEDKTKAQKTMIQRYHKFSPIINTNCNMNILCREFENVDFDIQWDKTNVSMLPYYDLNEFKFVPEILGKIRALYQRWSNKRSLIILNDIYGNGHITDDYYLDCKFGIVDAIRDELQDEYTALGLTPMEGLTYIKALSQSYVKFNFSFAWDILDDLILDCIDNNDAIIPVVSKNGEGEMYLGERYVLETVSKDDKNYVIDPETGTLIYLPRDFMENPRYENDVSDEVINGENKD